MVFEVKLGNNKDLLKELPDNSVDSIVTDPPYELGFMGKKWDGSGIAYDVEMWDEALRVLKPGGHLLAFSGSRTYHRMTCAIEDAGFEIRDQIMWVYGSGFPKSLDVSKAIDKANGRGLEDCYELGRHIRTCREAKGYTLKQVNSHFTAAAVCNHWEAQNRDNARVPTPEQWKELKYWLKCDAKFDDIVAREGALREVVGVSAGSRLAVAPGQENDRSAVNLDITSASLDAARQWEGWGTALKPAHEPICVARKPLVGTVAANVLAHGTGALNIDGCRVATDANDLAAMQGRSGRSTDNNTYGAGMGGSRNGTWQPTNAGRWPANLIHDGSDEVRAAFPNAKGQQGDLKKQDHAVPAGNAFGQYGPKLSHAKRIDSDTSAARFFYCAKASKLDRGEGNNHPTVKPNALMRYLCRLVTPPGGKVLDIFNGSGSTGIAAVQEGFDYLGFDITPEYVDISNKRIQAAYDEIKEELKPKSNLLDFLNEY